MVTIVIGGETMRGGECDSLLELLEESRDASHPSQGAMRARPVRMRTDVLPLRAWCAQLAFPALVPA